MDKQMTPEQLTDHIKGVVAPLIKETVGKEVADVVQEAVKEALKVAPKGDGPAKGMLDAATGGDASKVKLAKGNIGSYVRALAAAKNDKERAYKVAKQWGYDDVAQVIADSNEKAMSAGDPTAGGFLVPEEFSSEVIEFLRAGAVVRSLDPITLPMTSGTVKIPRISDGTTATYVGENQTIEKTQLKTGQLTLTWKKLAALVPISNDLIRYSSPSADTIVRDDMIRAMAAREDLAFISGDGIDGTPRGLEYWIADGNKFDANATVNLQNVTADLGLAVQLLMNANITLIMQQGATGQAGSARPGWIFHPRTWRYLSTVQTALGTYAFRDEMLRGTLWGFPYRVTTQCSVGKIFFGAFAHAVIGESLGIMVDASQDAAYHDGNGVVAAFSQDQTVVRVIAEHDFALRHDRAFSLVQDVTWGA